MEDHHKTSTKVVQFRLTREVALRRVRELAQDSQKLRWSNHIRERMIQRGIDSDAVLRVLRTGYISEDPIEGRAQGEWKLKVVRKMTSGRVAGVVTILVRDDHLRLVTAEWEDFI